MSSKMKWAIGIVVVVLVVLCLWWSGVLGSILPGASVQQSATVLNSQPSGTAGALADSVIDASLSGIDTQIAAIGKTMSGITTPTKAQVNDLAASFQAVNSSMGTLGTVLGARIKNTGASASPLQATITDLGRQLSNMTSQVGAASKNATATSSSATLGQSLKQLQTAQTYLQAARADIKVVVQGLKIK